MSLAAPVTFAVISGALPTGLNLNSSGLLTGIPSSPGPFTFTIRATGSDGNFTQRTYTQAVAGIDNIVLADATENQPYAEALTQTGMSGSITWSISEGVLPAGISLQPFTGVLSGTATESGDFPFTVSITNGTETCSTDLILTVIGLSPTVWWPLNEVGNVSRFDSIAGVELFVAADPVTSAAGKVSLASQHIPLPLSVSELFTQIAGAAPLAYQGAGFDAFGWINPVAVTGYAQVIYQHGFTGDDIFSVNMEPVTGFIRIFVQGDGLNNETILLPFPYTPGTWVFWRVFFDAATQRFGAQLNDGAITLSAVRPLAASPGGFFILQANSVAGLGNYLFDETGLFLSEKLSDADASAIYNAGAGRTFP